MSSLFIYSKPATGFSGQAAATELIIEDMRDLDLPIIILNTPYLDRASEGSWLSTHWKFLRSICNTVISAIRIRLSIVDAVHLNLGQTLFSLLRDGITLAITRFACGEKRPTVVALHGSVFTEWDSKSLEAKLFRWVINQAKYVTCLGRQQQAALVRLGICREKIVIVPNVCEYDPVDRSVLQQKHGIDKSPVHVLYLSSLIDTKGFPEYLEALELLGQESGPEIKAVLCGPVTMSPYAERFSSVRSASNWINCTINRINQSSRVQVKWIPGAEGETKQQLFEQAQVFVLPTRYRVEAQPIAIIEAMAWGCAIVTTNIGEIPATICDKSASILDEVSSESTAEAIDALVKSSTQRLRLSKKALRKFEQHYTRYTYTKQWLHLLSATENL